MARGNTVNAQSADQPMALLKVIRKLFVIFHFIYEILFFNRTMGNEQSRVEEENNLAQVKHLLNAHLTPSQHPVTRKQCLVPQISQTFPLPNHRGQIIWMSDQRLACDQFNGIQAKKNLNEYFFFN